MPVSKRTRYEVLKRDNHSCRYCGSMAPDVVLQVDHVTPVSLGGTDKPDNLVAACKDCNAGKASTNPGDPLVADVSQRAIEWGAAIAHFNQIQMTNRRKRVAFAKKVDEEWTAWQWGDQPMPRPGDWEMTLFQFYATGIPVVDVIDAAKIACGHRRVHPDDAWRYFCGVVWHKVTEMQDGAKALLEAEAVDGP